MSDVYYPLVSQLSAELRRRDWQLAVAESCTGGGLAYQLTALAGSSVWFERGFVTYSNAAKMELLGVSAETLDQYGAVSEATARAMAEGVLLHSSADMALSITGVAGPDGGSDEKPVGTVWFGLAQKTAECLAIKQLFSGDRAQIRQAAIRFALNWLVKTAK